MIGFESFKQAGAVVRQVTNARGPGLLFRLAYLVLVLAVTLPIVFYALAAYQYQVDAAAIAEEHDLDAGQLLARAAAWNTAMQDWTALVEAGAKAAKEEAADGAAPEGEPPQSATSDEETDASDAAARDAAARETAQAQAKTAREKRVLAAYRDAVAGVETSPLSAEGDRVARTLASELQRFDRLGLPWGPSWYTRPSVLAELPGWTLTLVVTLAAGLLGSLIFVLKAMLRQLLDSWSTGTTAPCRPRPWSWLLLRPVFGVVIALGAYVALQSGLLVIDGAMSLTPSAYVTAAVGLIAGLLSWQMIDTIETVGERWLASQRPLWAYGLDAQMKERGRAPEELAKTLGVSDPLMGDWIAVRVPVPTDTAKRIAAELNVCPEQLFQPVPPWRRSDQQTAT
jgi:hypothetical protein